jgi:hypothetical protein
MQQVDVCVCGGGGGGGCLVGAWLGCVSVQVSSPPPYDQCMYVEDACSELAFDEGCTHWVSHTCVLMCTLLLPQGGLGTWSLIQGIRCDLSTSHA